MSIIQRGKAVWTRFSRTELWRAWARYGDRRGNRLAGASSFFAFLSMFPLIVLAAAIIGPLLGDKAIAALKKTIEHNLPGIGDKINIDALIANAGTIGLISAVGLLFTGLAWIDSLRASIRSMHELDDQPGNFAQRKVADLLALIGLGLIALIGTGASSLLTGFSKRIVDATDLDGTWLANWGFELISILVGVAAGAVLFLYVQTALPRIVLPPKVAAIAAAAGAVLFYLAEKLGNLYVTHVVGRNAAYGALATPLALLVWIYLLTRATMLIAAWTKEATLDARTRETVEALPEPETVSAPVSGPVLGPVEEPLLLGPPGKRYKVVPIPQRKADSVAVAAGAVLGVTLTTLAVQATRAVRSLRR